MVFYDTKSKVCLLKVYCLIWTDERQTRDTHYTNTRVGVHT
jgi:hypothetical protein